MPFTDYPDFVGGGCEGSTAAGVDDTGVGEPVPDIDQQCTAPTPVGGATGAAVLAVDGGQLVLLERAATERSDVYAERVVQRPGGTWLVLSYDRLVDTSDGAELVLPIGLRPTLGGWPAFLARPSPSASTGSNRSSP